MMALSEGCLLVCWWRGVVVVEACGLWFVVALMTKTAKVVSQCGQRVLATVFRLVCCVHLVVTMRGQTKMFTLGAQQIAKRVFPRDQRVQADVR
jgi:hypothetical protein